MSGRETETIYEVRLDTMVEGTFDDEESARDFMKDLFEGTMALQLVRIKTKVLAEMKPKKAKAKR